MKEVENSQEIKILPRFLDIILANNNSEYKEGILKKTKELEIGEQDLTCEGMETRERDLWLS